MRKYTINIILFFLVVSLLQAYAPVQTGEDLFQEAKILIFDKKWEAAQEILDKILEDFRDRPCYSQALYYKAKCLEKQRAKELEALQVYKSYTALKGANKNLVEESEVAVIDLSFRLYEKGKISFIKEIEKSLESKNRVIRYYAAVKLGYVDNKKRAKRGLPVLKKILKEENDDELRDRAKLAILRIDPEGLNDFIPDRYEPQISIFSIEVIKEGVVSFSLNIPWSLADLAFSAIPEEEKALMKREGYDLDKIIKELARFKGNVIEFRNNDTIVRLWVK